MIAVMTNCSMTNWPTIQTEDKSKGYVDACSGHTKVRKANSSNSKTGKNAADWDLLTQITTLSPSRIGVGGLRVHVLISSIRTFA
jgi:hypothetical protein